MTLEKIKSRYGSISPSRLWEIRAISVAAWNILNDLPKMIAVIEASMEVDVAPRAGNFHELSKAIDRLEEVEDEKTHHSKE